MIRVSTLDKYTYDYGDIEKKKWFRNNDKLIIVRHNDKHQGKIIGSFYDDVAAFEHIENQMRYEGKIMTILAMNWIEFYGYVNIQNNTYKYKIIRNACYRDKKGSIDSEECFWFHVVENNCLL